MFKGSTAAVVTAGALWAGQANAAQMIYDVTLTGHLVSGSDEAGVLHVGDTITLTTRFTDDYAVQWGDTGYTMAGVGFSTSLNGPPDNGPPPNALPLSGPLFWRIDLGPYIYGPGSSDDFGEFYEYYRERELKGIARRRLEGPVLALKDGQVAGFYSSSWLSGFTVPFLGTGAPEPRGVDRELVTTGLPIRREQSFAPLPINGDKFLISGWIGSQTTDISFRGVWDLSSSVVTIAPIPEPSTWAMMLLGFFGLGAAVRGRRRLSAMA